MRSILVLVVLVGACAEQGAVRVVLVDPADDGLSPVDDRLARVSLVVETAGRPPRVETRPVFDRTGPLDLGELPVAESVRLSLEAEAATGRLLGYGRAEPVAVAADEVVEVPIRLRRPFAYVAGDANLAVFDTTVDPGQPYQSTVALGAPPAAVAATPDGAELVVVVGDRLLLASTATHRPLDVPAVPLAAPGTDVAVSPDSQWAVVAHATGASVVHLPGARAGSGQAVLAPVGNVGAIAVGDAVAWALVDATADCVGVSTVRPIPLATPDRPGDAVTLDAPAQDIAAGPSDAAFLLALPCRDQVVRVDVAGGSASQSGLLDLPGATAVAVWGTRAWAAGRTTGDGAHLVLASVNLDGSSLSVVDLPSAEERAKSDDMDETGQTMEVRMDADDIDVYDLAVLPGGAHVAVLVHAAFQSTEVWRTLVVLGVPVDVLFVPRIDVVTYEFLLLDALTGTPAQRLRTRCDITWPTGEALFDRWSCTRAPGQDQAASPYTPTHVGVLHGGR